ncbi:MAG: hypothetical protein ACKOCB_04445 [Planctomycetia bacterium]
MHTHLLPPCPLALRLVLAALLGWLCLRSTPCQAAPDAAGQDRARALRAALPEPAAEHRIAFWGEVWDGPRWKGSVRVEVEPSTLDERITWTAREEWRWLDGASDRHQRVVLTLGRDLTVLQLELSQREGARERLAFLAREGGRLTGTRREIVGEEEGAGQALALEWPESRLAGLGCVALLARAQRASPGAISIGWVPTQLWHGSDVPASGALSMEPGSGSSEVTLAWTPSSSTRTTRMLLALDAARGVPSGWTGLAGEAGLQPAGWLPTPDTFDEAQPARAWQHGFRTFGVGYHMARPELLERAFAWEALYAYETSLEDGWPASSPLEEFKQAWLAEFMKQSKHRSRADTDALLAGTLGTATVTYRSPDHVVMAAIAQFGGGEARTYQLRRGTDGIWRLVRFG